jgi:hypothetical protein
MEFCIIIKTRSCHDSQYLPCSSTRPHPRRSRRHRTRHGCVQLTAAAQTLYQTPQPPEPPPQHAAAASSPRASLPASCRRRMCPCPCPPPPPPPPPPPSPPPPPPQSSPHPRPHRRTEIRRPAKTMAVRPVLTVVPLAQALTQSSGSPHALRHHDHCHGDRLRGLRGGLRSGGSCCPRCWCPTVAAAAFGARKPRRCSSVAAALLCTPRTAGADSLIAGSANACCAASDG